MNPGYIDLNDKNRVCFKYIMKEYTDPGWEKILAEQNLKDFDVLWNLKLDLLDEPNTQRSGWSSVARTSICLPNGEKQEIILKRQLNHNSRTYMHPVKGIPTFEKEMENSLEYARLGIPALKVIHYASRRHQNGIQAVLMTEYLSEYRSLDVLLDSWEQNRYPELNQRKRIIEAIAGFVRHIHENKIQHNCLYPKHVFIRQLAESVDIRVIDLEKSKWRPFGIRRRVRDLESLSRRMGSIKNTDLMRFILKYQDIQTLNPKAKRLCRKIMSRTKIKLNRRYHKGL